MCLREKKYHIPRGLTKQAINATHFLHPFTHSSQQTTIHTHTHWMTAKIPVATKMVMRLLHCRLCSQHVGQRCNWPELDKASAMEQLQAQLMSVHQWETNECSLLTSKSLYHPQANHSITCMNRAQSTNAYILGHVTTANHVHILIHYIAKWNIYTHTR